VGHVEVAGVRYELPDGRVLLDDVGFRVGEGAKAALVGANGAGKTTLLRIITGELTPHAGAVTRSGGLGVMRQAVGRGLGDDPSVADLLLSVSPDRVRAAAAEVERLELRLMEVEDEDTQMRYATALADFADAGGYDIEVVWDTCCTTALGIGFDKAKYRTLSTLSGGEQKRLVLEYLLAGPDQVLLLDEPDNYLDVPGKQWLEKRISESPKTILFISHDRQLLANTATRSCSDAGTRSTPSSRRLCCATRSRPSTTTAWPRSTGRRRPGCGSSRRPARRRRSRGSSR